VLSDQAFGKKVDYLRVDRMVDQRGRFEVEMRRGGCVRLGRLRTDCDTGAAAGLTTRTLILVALQVRLLISVWRQG
jgi:hypothetical protein